MPLISPLMPVPQLQLWQSPQRFDILVPAYSGCPEMLAVKVY